jgi:HEAT repeat protein
MLSHLDECTRKNFLDKLSDPNPEERKNGIRRLGVYLGVSAVEPICIMLKERNYEVREEAIKVLLGMTEGPTSKKVLSIEEPGKLADAVEPLINALNATRTKLNNFAYREKMGELVDKNQETKEVSFLSLVITALNRIGDLRAEGALNAVVNEKPWASIDEEAVQALEAIRKRVRSQ